MWIGGTRLPPPHPVHRTKPSRKIGAALTNNRLRLRQQSPNPNSIKVHARSTGRDGEPKEYADELVVTGAVVNTFTIIVCAPLPVISTEELDKLQVGGAVAGTGAIAQLRLTVPVNDPNCVNVKLKLAVCPALTVCDVADPEARPNVKSGGGRDSPTPVPLTAISNGLIRVLSAIVMAPDCRPAAVGEKVTLTPQLVPGSRLVPQSLF